MTRLRLPLAAAGLVLVTATTGCSLGSDAFNENYPIDRPETQPKQIIRSPAPVEEGLPYETPPAVVPLPGPSGGLPGDTPTIIPPFSPGASSDSEGFGDAGTVEEEQ